MVLNEYVGKGKSPGKSTSGRMISGREQEVLSLIAEGFSNKQIARELSIGETTVKGHVANILGKLELVDRTQAAVYAGEWADLASDGCAAARLRLFAQGLSAGIACRRATLRRDAPIHSDLRFMVRGARR